MTVPPDKPMDAPESRKPTNWPQIGTLGVDGLLVRFGDKLSETANRAALAFRAALERSGPDGIEETSTSLVSVYLRFDPMAITHDALTSHLRQLVDEQDWFDAALPEGRRFWRIPTVFGTELAPQLEEAANAAGVTVAEAVRTLCETRVRVQTIGFAPGQPYLGELPDAWNIPRQSALTDKVPEGALTVAIRQFVLFSVASPTGWRHVGQTALRLFRPDTDTPFVLRPGDEVLFCPATPEKLSAMRDAGPDGGARWEPIR